jgi:hypothetical protein
MTVQRPDTGDRRMVAAADDNGYGAFGKPHHDRVRPTRAMRVHDERADVVERDTALLLACRTDGQEAAMDGKEKPFGFDVDDTFHDIAGPMNTRNGCNKIVDLNLIAHTVTRYRPPANPSRRSGLPP